MDFTETEQTQKRDSGGYRFKFSIIMSVYKVEEFIDEAVESLLIQTIGFRENVQIVMVDDGSPDGSGAICDRYGEQYPDNIIVVHKENGGLSSARNEGLRHVEGQYVNFFDPDDILTPDTLEKVADFFDAIEKSVDMVAIPMVYFGAKTGNHPTNAGKFNKGNRIIDLRKDYTLIHNSVASSFIKHEKAVILNFDEKLTSMEDAKALIGILIDNPRYGVVPRAKYMYRQRVSGAPSLSQADQLRKNWYTDFLRRFSLALISFCKEKVGYVPYFVQAVILYDLQWKFKQKDVPDGILSDEEKEEYWNTLLSVFENIDDKVFLDSKFYFREVKSFVLSHKYPGQYRYDVYDNDLRFLVGNHILSYASNMSTTAIERFEIKDDVLHVDVNTFIPVWVYELFRFVKPCLLINDSVIDCKPIDRKCEGTVAGHVIQKNLAFFTDIPLSEDLFNGQHKASINIGLMLDQHMVYLRHYRFSDFCPVSDYYQNQFAAFDCKYILHMNDHHFEVILGDERKIRKQEKAFLKEMWKKNRLGERKAVVVRKAVDFLKKIKKKKILIISDRMNKADDNGEALLHFLNDHPDYVKENHLKYYYVISKDCEDYKRLKCRHVIPVLGMKHKILHLLCDWILSSHADDFINLPMRTTQHCYRDMLYNKKFVFLQHGVTKDDISGWLNKYNKDIRGFITAAKPETKSLYEYDYFYSEREIWELGFARFDRLYCDEKKYITLMPTWRKYLMNGYDNTTGIWQFRSGVELSEYYRFYDSLINDRKLLDACEKYGYTLCFMPHPNIIPHIEVFHLNEKLKVFDINTKYRDVYAHSNLVLTDYSSAVFDFAYLRKPVVYAQFDKEEFFKGEHVYTKGYFDYERDGFGEVTYDLDSTVDLLIDYMKNDCKLKDKYRERIDNFFAFNDQNNCKRILDKILELEQQ